MGDVLMAFGFQDPTSTGLYRARETSGCTEAGPSEDVTGYVCDDGENPELPSFNTNIHLLHRSQYSNEAYDYPPNIRESFSDLGRTIAEKAQLLSHATSPAEAQTALTAPPSAKPQPKTFNHAIARAALASSSILKHQPNGSSGEDPLAIALEKYALAMEKVGEARLEQDAQIQSHYLAGWNTTLNTNLAVAAKARKSVENSRLLLDAAKARAKQRHGGGRHHDQGNVNEEARLDVEQAEDEFVGQTEEAVSVMKNVRSQHYILA